MTSQEATGEGAVSNVRRMTAFVGVYLILVSQFLVFSQPLLEETLMPPYTWLAVVGVFVVISSQLMRPTPFLKRLSVARVFSDRVFWVLAGFLFSALGMLATYFFRTYTRVNYIPVVMIWLLGAVCYIYAFTKRADSFDVHAVWEEIKNRRVEILMVLLAMLAATLVRFYRLGETPRVLDGDEGAIGLFAQSTIEGRLSNPFALWDNFGAMYLQLINLSLEIFGINAFALRLLPAIGGVLAIPSVYLLGRQIGGKRIGLIAAFLIAFSHSHIHYSRIASVAYIQGTWLAPLELYFLLSGLEKRESWRTALSGALLAIHLSVYLTSQVVVGMIIAFMLLLLWFYRSWFKQRLAQAAVFWGAFVITVLPAALYFLLQPEEFTNRLDKDGTFQSGWLEHTIASTGQSAFEILVGRVAHAFLSLIYYPAVDFYGAPSPPLSMISTVMFFAGMGFVLWRLRKPSHLLLSGYFWAATVAIGLFALPPSADSYRMLMTLPAVMIMAAIGLDEMLQMLGFSWSNNRLTYGVSVSLVMLGLVIFNLQTYFFDFAGRCRFASDLEGRFASYLGEQVNNVSSEQQVYLLSDAIFSYGTHPSAFFLSRSRPVVNYAEPLEQMHPISSEVIIAPPSRLEELETWARANPGGELHYEYDCKNPILLMYIVP